MKRIKFKIVYCDHRGVGVESTITVTAKNINSGFRKVATLALGGMPENWNLHSIEFWAVES